MSRRLFGTDGLRGPAGIGPLSPTSLARLGLAVAHVVRAHVLRQGTDPGARPRALIGRDTRLSGPFVQAALTSGLLAGGVSVHDGGILPTPAVALLVRRQGYDVGLVISASHNPWQDNGVKILGPNGHKLDDGDEQAVEDAYFLDDLEDRTRAENAAASERGAEGVDRDRYASAIKASLRTLSLRGLHVVVDPGNGAQSGLGGKVLRSFGARVTVLNNAPDGRNINHKCGAVHTDGLRRAVRRLQADVGVAFDGDADRIQLLDEKGRLLDGDTFLAALAPRLRSARRLRHATVVGTVMTNGALEAHLAQRGIGLVRTAVGDRNIVREMVAEGYQLGGEPSGHVIVDRSGLLTGDGLYAALAWLRAMRTDRLAASELAGGYRPWPLEIVSLRVRDRPPLDSLSRTSKAIAQAADLLGDKGRLVVRYSGTEPKLRVMVESRKRALLDRAMAPVVAAVKKEIGA